MKLIWHAISLLAVMTILCGFIYPLSVMVFAKLFWSHQAQGSLIKNGDQIIGSSLIAQSFKRDDYFWPRPTGVSNLGPTSQALRKQIDERRTALASAYHIDPQLVPIDMLTSSGSGLDPHISRDNARLQLSRIIADRGLNNAQQVQLEQLIDQQLDAPYVNVLLLNMDLRSMLTK